MEILCLDGTHPLWDDAAAFAENCFKMLGGGYGTIYSTKEQLFAADTHKEEIWRNSYPMTN